MMFLKGPKSHQIFGLLLQENLSLRTFKNRLIWSHWSGDRQPVTIRRVITTTKTTVPQFDPECPFFQSTRKLVDFTERAICQMLVSNLFDITLNLTLPICVIGGFHWMRHLSNDFVKFVCYNFEPILAHMWNGACHWQNCTKELR